MNFEKNEKLYNLLLNDLMECILYAAHYMMILKTCSHKYAAVGAKVPLTGILYGNNGKSCRKNINEDSRTERNA